MPTPSKSEAGTVARVVLTSEQGSLFDQLNRIRDRGAPPVRPSRLPPPAEPIASQPLDQTALEFASEAEKLTPPLANSLFQFQAPAGAEVVNEGGSG